MAAALAARGVTKGDRVLVQATNGNQLFESMFVCFRLGAVWVPTNFRQTPAEVAYLASASGATALICGAELSRTTPPPCGRPARTSASSIAIGGAAFGADYDALVARASRPGRAHRRRRARRSVLVLLHLGHHRPPEGGGADPRPDGLRGHQPPLRPDAGHHRGRRLAGRGAALARRRHPPAGAGRGAARRPCSPPATRLDPAEVWDLVERWRITNLFTVPTIVKLLTEHPAVAAHDHSSLRHVIYAGAPMYRADQKHALRVLGPVLVQYFGLGEVTGNITVLPPRLHAAEDGPDVKVGTCGFERTGMQVADPGPGGARGPGGRDRRDLRLRPGGVRGLLRQPGGQRGGVPRRLVPHRRPRPLRRGGLPVHHRPRLGHVHLRRLERVSAGDRGEAPDPPGDLRGRDPRRAGPGLGRGRRGGLRRPARGCGGRRRS